MTRITALQRSFSDRWFKTTPGAAPDPEYGIKVLYEPEVADVDIVFVHGITGHREGTWTAADGNGPWPQSLLPSLLPRARILTFGYDAAVMGAWSSVSGNRIGDHARNLLSALAAQRALDPSGVALPLIFVAHSLGGLVVKDAMLASRTSPEAHLRTIHDCTQGILFLGTPHIGSSLATVADRCVRAAALVGARTNTKIVQVLRRDSEVLDRIQHEFHEMLRMRPLSIICFYEELAMPGIGVIVPRTSAVLPGYTAIGIHSHHRDIARFARASDPGFLSIVGQLRRLVADNSSLSSSQMSDIDSKSDATLVSSVSSLGEDMHPAPPQGSSGITIWGNVYNSSVVNGHHTIAGDLVFSR
ncbi:hypothetical protein Micbo1qcDRAFT_223460 [Microdochium bolleyi]|uniref:DUF676 domain-containing protein n=1 Tax=Microdochium bolleyi TaxID=196109 RepID=A0A136IKK8_9PEZI|nr:hypothetical protein Micbo1qcDRAFT_223460 [Microdochium bolleyi]